MLSEVTDISPHWRRHAQEHRACKFPRVQSEAVSFVPLDSYYQENTEANYYRYLGQGEMTAIDTYSCSNCGASDGKHLYALWLEQEIAGKRIASGTKLMQLSPEPAQGASIKQKQLFDYATADLVMEGADHHVVLMHLPFADESIDFFICSHVLEHAPDDRQAIQELYRISKKGARGILMAPIIFGLTCTDEETIQGTPKERWRRFGQDDHVRLYAHDDYVQRIFELGFNLYQLDQSYFSAQTFKRLGLKDSSILYIVSKT